MISDLEQPAKLWLADVIDNFNLCLKEGIEPSLIIDVRGVEIEISLKTLIYDE